MPVSFLDLQLALEFVSGGGMGENEVYLYRKSGKIYWYSEFDDNDEELPGDIDTRNTPESSISASLWPWISLVSSYPTTTTKFATSSAEEALTVDLTICWCDGVPSTCGTIFRTRPSLAPLRKPSCWSGQVIATTSTADKAVMGRPRG